MSDKIAKLVTELQEKNTELQLEINNISKTNLLFLDELKKKVEWDKELLKDWYEEYWHTYSNQSSENEWFIAVPKFIPFSIGWLDHTTKGYNVFKINQYTQWLGDMPEFLRKELNIKDPEKIFVSEGNLIFTEGKEEEIREKHIMTELSAVSFLGEQTAACSCGWKGLERNFLHHKIKYDMQNIECNQCKKEFERKEAIKVTIKGDNWYFCDWECLDLFAGECLGCE